MFKILNFSNKFIKNIWNIIKSNICRILKSRILEDVGFQRIPTGSNGFLNGFPRIPTDSNGNQWIPTDSNGFQF